METLQYVVSTDAFTAGPYFYPRETVTFTVERSQTSVSLAAQTFGGWPLGDAVLDSGNVGFPTQFWTIEGGFRPFVPFLDPHHGDFWTMDFETGLAPTKSGVPVTYSHDNFFIQIHDWTPGNGHEDAFFYTASVHGSVTQTGFNLPEPATLGLLALGVAALVTSHRRRHD